MRKIASNMHRQSKTENESHNKSQHKQIEYDCFCCSFGSLFYFDKIPKSVYDHIWDLLCKKKKKKTKRNSHKTWSMTMCSATKTEIRELLFISTNWDSLVSMHFLYTHKKNLNTLSVDVGDRKKNRSRNEHGKWNTAPIGTF